MSESQLGAEQHRPRRTEEGEWAPVRWFAIILVHIQRELCISPIVFSGMTLLLKTLD